MLKPSFVIFKSSLLLCPYIKQLKTFLFIGKKIKKILSKIRLNETRTKDAIIHESIIPFSNKFWLNPDKKKYLPIMYWTPKIHKQPIDASFIDAWKKRNTKQFLKYLSSIKYKLSMINHISILYLNNFGL